VPMRALEHLARIEIQLADWRAEHGLDVAEANWAEAAEASIALALRRLDALQSLAGLRDASIAGDGLVASIERDALRGSAWKRKAGVHARQLVVPGIGPKAADGAGRQMIEALGHSVAAYRRAEGAPGSGEFKPCLALNRLALDALTDWISPAERDSAIALAQTCRQLGLACAADACDIWDALMPSEALLAERLIDGSLGRADEAGAGFFDEVAKAYADAFATVAAKPVEIDQVVRNLEILARFCDALALVQHDDAALSLTADRLLDLVRRIQPRQPRRDRTAPMRALKEVTKKPATKPKKKAAAKSPTKKR
jgi:hypothetical protein